MDLYSIPMHHSQKIQLYLGHVLAWEHIFVTHELYLYVARLLCFPDLAHSHALPSALSYRKYMQHLLFSIIQSDL
jgi:hypothetical protein